MSYIGNEPRFTQFPSKFFNGDGTAMTVSLDYAPPNKAALLVFISGVRQDTDAYTLSGTSLTFTGSVPSGTDNVQVVHLGLTVQVPAPADDTITTAKIQDDAVTTAKIADDNVTTAKILDNNVTLAKLDDGTQGDILYYGASGAPARLGFGTSGDFLKTQGTGANPVWATITEYDDTGVQDDIALLGFKVATNGSLGKYNLVDQTEDAFMDATGVDASASTNELRNATGNYYVGATTGAVTVSGNYDSSAVDGDYTYYKWTGTTSSGTYTTDVEQDYTYLVVAGGGAGGRIDHPPVGGAGGGGGGGVRSGTLTIAAGTISGITVGAGGVARTGGGTHSDDEGDDSVFSTITSTGGGYGGFSANPNSGNGGGSGGSGGGGGARGAGTTPASGNVPSTSPAQGYDGGAGSSGDSGGGGGGAGGVGADGVGSSTGGNGGVGVSSSITGSAVFYGGGGGGGCQGGGSGDGGDGGNGGGGDGEGADSNDQEAGTANTGGGGGGAGAGGNGMDGGSGIVVIRRQTLGDVPGGNLTLIANSTTAEAVPTKGDMVMTYTDGVGTATLNTDLKGYVSRDNGTTYTQGTLASQGTTGGHTIVTFHNLDISSQPSGSAMRYKIETLNQSAGVKETRIQAVSLGWS